MKNPLILNKQDAENLNILHDLFKDHPKHFMKMLTSKNGKFKFLLGWIISKTPKLDDSYNVTTRVNWILTGRTEFPTCPTCGKQYGVGKNVKVVDGYADHCSGRCSTSDPAVIDKIEKTSFLRYGVRRAQQSVEIKDKIAKTNEEKYGCKCVLQNEDIKERCKNTLMEKYGVENCSQIEDVKKKKKISTERTLMEKYGVHHSSQIPGVMEKVRAGNIKAYHERYEEIYEKRNKTLLEHFGTVKFQALKSIREKRDNTTLERYGNKTTFLCDSIKKKSEETCMKKYGATNPFKSREFREWLKECCFKKYGVKCSFELPEVREKIRQTNLKLYGYIYGRPSRYKFENILFDSSWELAFWIFNRDNGINICRCFECFSYMSENITYKYYPDFKIDNEFIEIKGDQFFDEDGNLINPYDRSQDARYKAKQMCMEEHNVKILKRNDIIAYIEYVKEKYGEEFMDQFKIIH